MSSIMNDMCRVFRIILKRKDLLGAVHVMLSLNHRINQKYTSSIIGKVVGVMKHRKTSYNEKINIAIFGIRSNLVKYIAFLARTGIHLHIFVGFVSLLLLVLPVVQM